MSIELALQVIVALLGAYLVAFWFSLGIWAYKDISARSPDPLVRFLALLLVLVFNLPGLLLYYMLRPRETLAERYNRSLEEETLLKEVESQLACPSCGRKVEPDFILCPSCRTQLKQACANCNHLLLLQWSVCPYCGK